MGGETAVQGEKGIVGSGNRKSRVLGWETADQSLKGIVGSGNRKSRVLGGETADQVENGMVGSGWGKTAEKRGLKVQSPIGASGVVPGLQKKGRHVGKNNLFQRECYN